MNVSNWLLRGVAALGALEGALRVWANKRPIPFEWQHPPVGIKVGLLAILTSSTLIAHGNPALSYVRPKPHVVKALSACAPGNALVSSAKLGKRVGEAGKVRTIGITGDEVV